MLTQQIKAEVIINIPSDYVLIKKSELEVLEQERLSGVFWSMEDLEKRIKKKHEWIKENILYPSKFRKILDVENGGFVYYPKVRGEKWSFHATKMAKFLDDNFHLIFGR
ncbi:DUF771 domain-containing protein [Ureibacillus sp. FSL W8-0352]|uniref:DUF771 domain-containing protein n=1 Tax=Ureibacillus sp. FSL W8-0352 TaxID=2954596 RepID=UPI0030F8CAC1